MIGEFGGMARSGERGEFGGLIPVRPAAGTLVVCLRGHRLDLDLYDKLRPYSHRYRLHGTLCEVCRAQEGCDPAARRLAEWADLDVTTQYPPDAVPDSGLVLVVHPPAERSSAGRIELCLDGAQVGMVTLSMCAPCRIASLDYVHITAGYRRLGYGRTVPSRNPSGRGSRCAGPHRHASISRPATVGDTAGQADRGCSASGARRGRVWCRSESDGRRSDGVVDRVGRQGR
ncbi:MAG TPA: hypothetical protein VG674_23075, partial [Amycolatopsis sp.]|nr:hypothetical protein [Amycolatopsis sp.]